MEVVVEVVAISTAWLAAPFLLPHTPSLSLHLLFAAAVTALVSARVGAQGVSPASILKHSGKISGS